MPVKRLSTKLNARSSSWNYSNADSFNDDMYSNMTFYNTTQTSPLPHYATLPRGFRNSKNNKRQRGADAPPPYEAMESLLENYAPSDSGYSSGGSTSPSPGEQHNHHHHHHSPPTRQQSRLKQPNDRLIKSTYYSIHHTSNPRHPTLEHGITSSSPSSPSISFTCNMQPLALLLSSPPDPSKTTTKKRRRRITNNDICPPDTDPLSYIRNNCENATRALISHRRLHGCDCDFAYLDGRRRGTGSMWREGEDEQGEVKGLGRGQEGPRRACRKRWFTGWFVRQHMKFHDLYCGCGCFGSKL